MNDIEFDTWCKKNEITDRARAIVQKIRKSPPARNVQSGRGNVPGRYCSKKMGLTIQWESHTLELAAIFLMEHDPDVLEFFDQPAPKIKLEYIAKSGKKTSFLHTADFFVIRENTAGWEEWKKSVDLPGLAEKMPNRYVQHSSGLWYCPPGQKFAEDYGLTYTVKTSDQVNPILIRNIDFLEDYMQDANAVVADDVEVQIREILKTTPGITLHKLLMAAPYPDDIYQLISTNKVYIDLGRYVVVERDYCPVYLDEITGEAFSKAQIASEMATGQRFSSQVHLEVGNSITWDGSPYKVINVGVSDVSLLSSNNEIVILTKENMSQLLGTSRILASHSKNHNEETIRDILISASEIALQTANSRYIRIQPFLGTNAGSPKDRSLRRWVKDYKDAEDAYGNGFLGLLPKPRRGNRSTRVEPDAKKLAERTISSSYENHTQKTILEVYGEYENACEQEEVPLQPISYTTFTKMIHSRPLHDQIFQRQGRRAAYQFDIPHIYIESDTPRHGDYPFHIVHFDHTELDIELVCSQTGKNLGRPMFSALMDATTRRIFAIDLSYDPASNKTCMMIMRLCVQRYNRLPKFLVVDGGKEFHSTYFESLCAMNSVNLKHRPAAQPRHGSVIERWFRTKDTQLIHELEGNTQVMKLVRQVTKSVNPKNHAVWTLEELWVLLSIWCFEIYDQKSHPALNGMSPREAYEHGLVTTGSRRMTYIAYDENFQMMSLPTTDKKTAKVQPSRGVKINYIYYWNEQFTDYRISGKQVPVRYDPYNLGYAYAFINGQWLKCISELHHIFKRRTEREIMVAVHELKQRNRINNRNVTITAKTIADFILSAEGRTLVELQRLKDAALHAKLYLMGFDNDFNSEPPISVLPHDSEQRDGEAIDLKSLMVFGRL